MPTPATKQAVLLVDDDEVLRAVLRQTLENSDLDVMEATNGKEALAAIQARKPDVIITDIMMPVMDGIALIKNLKGSPSMSSIHIIAMSGTANEVDRSIISKLGANEFFDKARDIKDLLKKIRRILPNPTSCGSWVRG